MHRNQVLKCSNAIAALLAVHLGAVGASAATIVDYRPDHDNYVRNDGNLDAVESHTGNLNVTWLGTRRDHAFLKFDIASVPAGQVIQSATLTLRTRNDSASSRIEGVYGVADDGWDEATLTWNNQPAASSGLFFDQFTAEGTTAGGWPAGTSQLDALDVTAYVANQYNVNDDLISFRLTAEQDGTANFFRADEHADQSEHPWAELTIEYAPVPEPASIGLLGIGLLALIPRRHR